LKKVRSPVGAAVYRCLRIGSVARRTFNRSLERRYKHSENARPLTRSPIVLGGKCLHKLFTLYVTLVENHVKWCDAGAFVMIGSPNFARLFISAKGRRKGALWLLEPKFTSQRTQLWLVASFGEKDKIKTLLKTFVIQKRIVKI